jgi:hypothetical protein
MHGYVVQPSELGVKGFAASARDEAAMGSPARLEVNYQIVGPTDLLRVVVVAGTTTQLPLRLFQNSLCVVTIRPEATAWRHEN